MNTMDSDVANYDTVTLTLVNKWRIVKKYISTKIKAIKSYIIQTKILPSTSPYFFFSERLLIIIIRTCTFWRYTESLNSRRRDYAFNMATETSTPLQNSDTKGALGIPLAEFVVNYTVEVKSIILVSDMLD